MKVWLSPFKKSCFIYFNKSPLKVIKKYVLYDVKFFLFLRYLKFCADFFYHVGKWLDKKAEVNFKVCQSQPDNEILSVNIT